MSNTVVLQNTTVAPWGANNIGVYGGGNSIVANNLMTDSVQEYTLSIGQFGAQGGPIRGFTAEGNVILRGGSFGFGTQFSALAIGVADPGMATGMVIRGNSIIGTMFDGMTIRTGDATLIQNNVITAPGTTGIEVEADAQGSDTLLFNTVQQLNSGQAGFLDNSPSGVTLSGMGNVGFTLP
jgi:hypothetical protein